MSAWDIEVGYKMLIAEAVLAGDLERARRRALDWAERRDALLSSDETVAALGIPVRA